MQRRGKAAGWLSVAILLFFGWCAIWIYRTMLTPIYDEIQATTQAQSAASMGMISSVYFFGYVAMQIPGGILMDKFGIRKILVPGMCLFNAGVLIVGFAQGIGVGHLLHDADRRTVAFRIFADRADIGVRQIVALPAITDFAAEPVDAPRHARHDRRLHAQQVHGQPQRRAAADSGEFGQLLHHVGQ